MDRRDWLLRQFTRANYALAYCNWYIDRGYSAKRRPDQGPNPNHPGLVAMVTFRSAQEELRFNWALIRLMIRHKGHEGVRDIILARRERLKAEINAQGAP